VNKIKNCSLELLSCYTGSKEVQNSSKIFRLIEYSEKSFSGAKLIMNQLYMG